MNCPRPLMFAALTALAVLGCSDSASAQPVLTLTPPATASNPLVFNNIPSGGLSPSQNITVTVAGSTMATVIIQVSPSSPWLVVSPTSSVNIPATLSVACNTTSLTTGNYSGSFTMTVDGAPTDQVTVYVSLSVAGASQLSASPPSLAFSAQQGASTATPNGISVQILSSGAPLNYTIQAKTENLANWLLLSAESGSTGGARFTVSVNPSGLTAINFPAVFNGIISVFSTTTLDSVEIAVQLTLNSNAEISVTPTNPPPFLYQAGTAADPAPQQLAISSAGGSIAFTIQESPAVAWLGLSALSGTAGSTPDTITIDATPAENSLLPGTYTTSLIVTPSGESPLAAVPVTLVVAAHPLIQLSSNALSFTASYGGTLPSVQQVMVTSSAGSSVPVGFSVSSNQSWLTAVQSAVTTPATLTVQVNPGGLLTTQTYTGTLTISPTNGDPYTETITVSLTINSAAELVAGPGNLLFSYEIGQSPPESQTVSIVTTGQPLSFTVSTTTTTCGPNWLAVSPTSMTANTTLMVSVVTTGIAAGICSGTITLNYFGGIAPTYTAIQVTLAVSSSAELGVYTAPGFGIYAAPQGSVPLQQQISLYSTDPTNQVSYTASVVGAAGGTWLGIAGSTSGTTPRIVDLQYIPAALTTPGTYTGTVLITSPSLGALSQYTIPVTLTVTTTTTVSVIPPSLSFTEVQGGSPPAAQTLALSSTPGPATYTAMVASSTGGNWLQVSPASGNADGAVQVSVLPNTLSQGSYTAQISFAFQGASTTSEIVSVSLTVTAPQTVTASPTSLSFAYQIGGAQPSAQALDVTGTGGAVAISVSASSSGWLSVNPTSGSTPQGINVLVNPQGLAAQTYNGSISISAPGVLASALSIPVSFTVTSPPAPQPFLIVNNATGAAGAIAPGEELAIKGTALGPAIPAAGVLYSVDSAGGVSSVLAGVQVTFDNIPGTPIFVSADQIDVMVPYEINGRLSTTMVVLYNGVPSLPFQLSVAAAAPGLFTDNFSGTGQVAATNQNNSFNGTNGVGYAAAPRGTVVSLYGTGGGQTSPISTTGSVTPIPSGASGLLYIPNVTATVGGLPATVEFAGAAPGDVTGVFQVNVLIPANVIPGSAVPVTIAIGDISSPLGTTIAVQ